MPEYRPAQGMAACLALALALAAGMPATAGNQTIEQGDPLETREMTRPMLPDGGIRTYGIRGQNVAVPGRVSLEAAALQGGGLEPAPIAGVRRKISGTPMAGGVTAFAVTPTGHRAIFIANKDTASLKELYSTQADGSSAPVKISNGLVFGAGDLGVSQFLISPDGSRVVFLADADHTGGVNDIYSAPTDGSSPAIRLNIGAEAPVTGFGITPDSAHAVFLGTNTASAIISTEIFAAAIATPASARQLSDIGQTNAAGDVVAADLSLNGARVVYAGDGGTDEIFQWYSVPTSATGPGFDVQLSAALGSVTNARITPDSSRVVYTGDDTTAAKVEVFSIGIDGGARIKLNPSMAGAGASDLEISPDGLRVGYLADQTTASVTEVYTAAIMTAGSGTRVNTPLSGSQSAVTINITPDSTRMLYEADQTTPGTIDLFGAPVGGGAAPAALHALTPPSDAGRFIGLGTPIIGRRAVYPVFGATTVSLFSVRYDGSLPFQQISQTIASNDTMRNAFLPPSATRLMAYGVGPTTGTITDEITLVAIRGDLAAETVNPIAAAGTMGVNGYEIAADEQFVVYVQDADTAGKLELYSYEPDSDADGVLNGSDNCQFVSNPAPQGPVVFAPTLRALSSTAFTWDAIFDVRYVRGLMSRVKFLEVQTSGVLVEASGFAEPTSPPPGDGFYYLITHDCPGRSWQTVVGAEPGRDTAFP